MSFSERQTKRIWQNTKSYSDSELLKRIEAGPEQYNPDVLKIYVEEAMLRGIDLGDKAHGILDGPELTSEVKIDPADMQRAQDLRNMVLTTETSFPPGVITKRLGIITAECAFGMNLFKDLFAGVRDIVGGRSKATQGILRDARKTVLKELKNEAYDLGADAIIAVDLDYSEFSGGRKSMLFIVASGTAVKLSDGKSF